MDRLIYLAMAGAKATMQRQDVLANNLANASTTGFRAELQAFRAVPVRGDGASTRVYALESTIGYDDRAGIQQALDLGADGVLVPYINTADDARQAVSCARYPTAGTRSVYFPQRATNKDGLLGYVPNANKHVIIALQVEMKSCIDNMEAIAAVPGVDILFLGQNDLCMSMGLFETYEFPHMYTSPELMAATNKLITEAQKNNVILGLFLFGTSRVAEFLEKGFTFISIGNDLHHILTQSGAYVKELGEIAASKGKSWAKRPTALVSAATSPQSGIRLTGQSPAPVEFDLVRCCAPLLRCIPSQ